MELEIKHTAVFEKNLDAYNDPDASIIVNQGSTGSSKTISIAQLFIYLCLAVWRKKIIDIVRQTLPSLRATAMKDFFSQLKALNLYNEKFHNKTDNIYLLNGNEITFFSTDDEQKLRGRKADIRWLNEANEIGYDEFNQLDMRTSEKIFMDYNPSMEFHWIYDDVMLRPSTRFIHSTYKDNPFLEARKVQIIEAYKGKDENYWKIYGLGERGVSGTTIYTNYDIVHSFPDSFDETIYGLDFGYNHKTVLMEINYKDTEIYERELIYKSGLLNSDIIKWLDDNNISRSAYIYADSAAPDKIQEISNAGYSIFPSDKSVKDGIDYVKRQTIHIHVDSVNHIKEKRNYKWKTNKDGIVLDEPVKANDDSCDAERYPIYTHSKSYDPKMAFI